MPTLLLYLPGSGADFLWVSALQSTLVAIGFITGLQFIVEEVLLFGVLVIVKHRMPAYSIDSSSAPDPVGEFSSYGAENRTTTTQPELSRGPLRRATHGIRFDRHRRGYRPIGRSVPVVAEALLLGTVITSFTTHSTRRCAF